MMTATKTHRETCQEDWIISGGWRVFRICSIEWHHFRTEVGTAFGKICWVNWRIVSLWKIYFHRLCDTVMLLEYIVMVGECALFIHDCAVKHVTSCELNGASLWIINTWVFLSASPLNLANLFILEHLTFLSLPYMNNYSSLDVIGIMWCRNWNADRQ